MEHTLGSTALEAFRTGAGSAGQGAAEEQAVGWVPGSCNEWRKSRSVSLHTSMAVEMVIKVVKDSYSGGK